MRQGAESQQHKSRMCSLEATGPCSGPEPFEKRHALGDGGLFVGSQSKWLRGWNHFKHLSRMHAGIIERYY
jgi:hypothetical protein